MINLAQSIPAKVRQVIYSVLCTLFTIEVTLDAFGYGLVPERPQAAAFAVCGALGFGLASANVAKG